MTVLEVWFVHYLPTYWKKKLLIKLHRVKSEAKLDFMDILYTISVGKTC